MKANEFVKKFGFTSAKYWIDRFNNVNTLPDEFINIEFLNSLKSLVESHELVESYGGLDYARIDIFLHNTGSNYASRDKLKQAIADVEACKRLEVS